VDPISHAALARILIGLDGQRRFGPGAGAAGVLGALVPDLDLARVLQGWDVYLRAHQVGTHALSGAIACGLVTAAAVRPLARGGRFIPLATAATAGALSHVFLDLIVGASIRPFWPVISGHISFPLFAMADPWLFACCLLGFVMLWRGRTARVACLALVIVAMFVGAKTVLYVRARGIDRAYSSSARVTRADAVFGSWRRWTFFHADGESVDRWEIDAVTGRAVRSFRASRGLSLPQAIVSRELPTVSNLLASHEITFARVRPSPAGDFDVLWSDLRYCQDSLAGSDPVCNLWVGGEYDARGRPIVAVVHVGSLVHRRTPRSGADH
jgi:membrane-bound metal-dependent hydrolase YbcI (DUF457 family)